MVGEKKSVQIVSRKIISVLLGFSLVLFLGVLSILAQENSSRQIEKADFQSSPRKKGNAENVSSISNELLANDASALKMEVRGRGIYRVDAQSLLEYGFNLAQSGNWRLFAGGIEQPLIVNSDGSIEFYGEGLDTIQTDANVYWLMTDSSAGLRISRSAQSYIQSARDDWFRATVERRDRTNRLSYILNGERENWFGAFVTNTAAAQTLNLQNIAFSSGQTATLNIALQSISTSVNNRVSVVLNGVYVGEINFNAFTRKDWSVTVPVSNLLEGINTVTLQGLNTAQDVSATEAISISYPKLLNAQNNQLEFSVNAQSKPKISGFTTSQIRVFDVTNPAQVKEYAPESRQESNGTYSITLASSSTARLMIAKGADTQFLSAPTLTLNNPSNLRNSLNTAKLVVIAPYNYYKPLNELIIFREIQGIQTKFVDIEDIYDEFNNGVKSAEAIRSFLQYAKQNWQVKPDFALLVGDASADPRNFSGMGGEAFNQVPTMFVDTWNIEAPSDEMLADFNNDGISEIVLGRLPAQTREEADNMVQKIISISPMSREEINGRGIHFVSDDFVGYDFATASRNIASRIPANIAVNYLDRTTQPTEVLRNDIINRMNSGAAIVNYFGHGSTIAWTSASILRSADAQSLFNPKRPSLLVSLSCLNGDYTIYGAQSLAEAMMKRSQGGAFAVWAASGWNGANEEELMGRDFYQRVFAGMTLGEAAREVKSLYPTMDMRHTFIFFGDPTQKLVTP